MTKAKEKRFAPIRDKSRQIFRSEMTDYKFGQKLNDDLIGLEHIRYGRQLWAKSKIRKELDNTGRPRCCAVTGKVIHKGTFAYRPMTNGYNRMERISEEGMKMLEASK